MNKIIVGNWKMNILPSESVKYMEKLNELKTNNKIIILAPYIDLPYLRSDKIKFGSQNIHHKDSGTYTGEISPLMLKDIDINYCLIGHIERRKKFNETDSLINLKLRNAIKNNLNVILCVDDIKTLTEDLIGIKNYKNIIIAYEPTDYIGGYKVAPLDDIRNFIKSVKELTNNEIKIIYGGGININNINIIKQVEELDGILVGNSSIDLNEFISIIDNY